MHHLDFCVSKNKYIIKIKIMLVFFITKLFTRLYERVEILLACGKGLVRVARSLVFCAMFYRSDSCLNLDLYNILILRHAEVEMMHKFYTYDLKTNNSFGCTYD
jgi:hypothetical protein